MSYLIHLAFYLCLSALVQPSEPCRLPYLGVPPPPTPLSPPGGGVGLSALMPPKVGIPLLSLTRPFVNDPKLGVKMSSPPETPSSCCAGVSLPDASYTIPLIRRQAASRWALNPSWPRTFTSSHQPTKARAPEGYQQLPELAFFCRIEVKLEKAARMPVKFRLGDVRYVDYLEGKRRDY